MKKTIAIIGAAGVLLWLGASYLTGFLAEKETRNLVERLNQQSQDYGVTNIDVYDRGLLSSKVTYSYNLPPSLAAMTGYKEAIKYSCDYDHGLIGISYSCDLMSIDAYRQFVAETFNGEDPITITGSIAAFGGIKQTISVDAIDTEIDGGGSIKVGASEFNLMSSGGLDKYDVSATIGASNIIDETSAFNISDIKLDAQLSKTELGLFAGNYSLETDQLAVTGPDETFSVSGFELNGNTSDNVETMDSVIQVSIKRLKNDQSSDMTMEDVSLAVDFTGINTEALIAYQEFARNLQTDLLVNVEYGEEPQMDPNQIMALLPIIEKMLGKDLNIKVAIKAKLDGKPNSFDFNLKLLEKMTFTQLSAFMFDPASVLKKINLELETSLHKTALGSNPAALEAIAQNPMFVSKDGSYSTSLVLGETSFLNGKTVSIQELQALLMAGAQR